MTSRSPDPYAGPPASSTPVGDDAGPHRLPAATAVAVLLLGLAAVLGSRSLEYWTALGPGPGFFPTWLGVILALCSAVWLANVLREGRRLAGAATTADTTAAASVPPAPSGGPADADAGPPEYSLPTVVAIVGSLCVLAAVLEPLGYQLSMFVFLAFHLLVLGRRRLLLSLVIALGGSVGVFVVFTALLGVPLPLASVPFLNALGL